MQKGIAVWPSAYEGHIFHAPWLGIHSSSISLGSLTISLCMICNVHIHTCYLYHIKSCHSFFFEMPCAVQVQYFKFNHGTFDKQPFQPYTALYHNQWPGVLQNLLICVQYRQKEAVSLLRYFKLTGRCFSWGASKNAYIFME